MDDLQNQMNAILQNPEMMQTIMTMAQSLGQSQQPQSDPTPKRQEAPALPDIDLSTIQRLSGLAGQSNIDNNQRSLLNALTPYLNQERLHKLEKAMRAARMANMASAFLGSTALSNHTGR